VAVALKQMIGENINEFLQRPVLCFPPCAALIDHNLNPAVLQGHS